MREILFRGKNKETGKWVYGDLMRGAEIGKVCSILIVEFDKETLQIKSSEVIPESVGQYTGLKDKNGKEIYEGDIVRADYELKHIEGSVKPKEIRIPVHHTGVIVFVDGCFKLRASGACDTFYLELEMFKEIEVTGTFYENKKLLEEL